MPIFCSATLKVATAKNPWRSLHLSTGIFAAAGNSHLKKAGLFRALLGARRSVGCGKSSPGTQLRSGFAVERRSWLQERALGLGSTRDLPCGCHNASQAFVKHFGLNASYKRHLSASASAKGKRVEVDRGGNSDFEDNLGMGNKRGFQIVVAATPELGIGANGSLPWKIKRDMQFFKTITGTVTSPDFQHAVIMGRRTWESIPQKFRPLPGRLNVVLTREQEGVTYPEGVVTYDSLDAVLGALASPGPWKPVENTFALAEAKF